MSDSRSGPTSDPTPSTKVRLASIQPARDVNNPIAVKITNVDPTQTAYECISYDRAEVDKTKIVIDDEGREISSSLDSALRSLRQKDEPVIVWADVLASNTDATKQIFANANRTICYVAAENDSSAKAFDIVQSMAKLWEDACALIGVPQDISLGAITQQQLTGLREHLLSNSNPEDFDTSNETLWKEINSIFGAAYWNGVNCVPDIVLSQNPVVGIGQNTISWTGFISALRSLVFLQAKFFGTALPPHVMTGFEVANSIEIATRRRRNGEPVELFPMIQTARDCVAQDPRDYVFSMIPLANPSARRHFHNSESQTLALPTVDYSKSVQEVYTEAAKYVVLERQDLMVWYGERPPCGKRINGLPSWVPDFSVGQPKTTVLSPNNGLRVWWDTLSVRKEIKISDDNALQLQVYPFDRIEHVSPVISIENMASICLDEAQALMQSTGGPDKQRDEEFCRTLILNFGGPGTTLRERVAPGPEVIQAFESFLAQSTVLKLLDCKVEDLATEDMRVKMTQNPQVMALMPFCGRGDLFAALMAQTSLGRRFFKTESGRFGMTAVEDVVRADPDFGEEDIHAEEDTNGPKGVSKGDIVAACIGGFFPYILRPHTKVEEDSETVSQGPLLSPNGKYEFVGDCYLHGAMDGEDFKQRTWLLWSRDITDVSKIVDINVV
ncbi:hypothetical protein F5Y16DRAFT_370865 [Xylariaceae sp. FL0255]|nr:hypothetical protein F5Y16DRAFT_370865 [Xylariaceae sp. FL0255]